MEPKNSIPHSQVPVRFLSLSQGQYFFGKDTTMPSLGVQSFLRLNWPVCVLLISFNIDVHFSFRFVFNFFYICDELTFLLSGS